MAATDATSQPVKNQAYRLTRVFTLVTTGEESSGTLTSLAATVSKDQGAAATATGTPTQVGTTGLVYLDLTATEMNADTVVVRFTSALANTTDQIAILNPVDLSEVAGRPDTATVKKPERYILSLYRRWMNKRTQNRSTGAFTTYMADESTTDVTGSVTQAADVITVGESA